MYALIIQEAINSKIVLRFLVVFLALSLVAHEWGYDVTGIIAGLGLGCQAFALAAKDTGGESICG